MNHKILEGMSQLRIIEDANLINLNSAYAVQRNGSFLSNVLFPTNGLIIQSTLIDHIEIQVLNCQFPTSFYVVNSSNNKVNYLVASTNYSFSIPVGNYYYDTLITALQQGFAGNTTPISVSFSSKTGCLTFSYSAAFSILNTSTCQNVIGFSTDLASVSNSITMPSPLNLLGPKKIKIFSGLLPTSNYDSSGLGSCLISISQNAGLFSLLSYDNGTQHKNILRTTFVNNIDLLITDEYNTPLDFNNENWSITIRLAVFRYYLPSLSTFSQIMNSQKFIDNEQDDGGLEPILSNVDYF
jgi:hypothetical protein